MIESGESVRWAGGNDVMEKVQNNRILKADNGD